MSQVLLQSAAVPPIGGQRSPMRLRAVSVALACSLMVTGCANMPGGMPGMGGTSSGDGNAAQACNPMVVGLIAAAGCGILNNGKTSHRIGVAAACAAAAMVTCYLVNAYTSRKVKDEQTAVADYRASNPNAGLPVNATLTRFTTTVSPDARAARGSDLSFVSDIVVIPGQAEPNVKVEQEVSIVDAQNEVWGKPTRKVANTAGGGGEFETTFKVPIGKNMEEGNYRLTQAIYINNRRVQDTYSNFQVLASGEILPLTTASR